MSIASARLDLTPWLAQKQALTAALTPERIGAVLGRRMALTYLPRLFKKGGDPAWPKPKYRDGPPLMDVGRLASSFLYKVTGSITEVWTPLVYAGPQHRGDTVTPKKAKFLAVPLSTLTVSERRSSKPRDFSNTFVWRSPASGKLFIVQTQGKGKNEKFRFLYILLKSVKLPARPFMEWSPAAIADVHQALQDLIKAGLK